MSEYEEGLIGQYVDQVQALAVRAEANEDVTAKVETVVANAVEHFRVVKSSDLQANLSAFKGRLSIASEVAHSSQPKFKETLQYAAKICPTKI